jgi:succinate dehydrogenase / fumarate reductase cytochrome b subunit
MKKKNRPLSPHLVIYKPEVTSIISIFHRIAGSALTFTLLIFTFIIYLDTINSEYYIVYLVSFYFSYFYLLVISFLNFILVIFCFHLLNGLRHLSWDFRFGLDIKKVYITGLVVLISSLVILFTLL